jgi:hypothetical protein
MFCCILKHSYKIYKLQRPDDVHTTMVYFLPFDIVKMRSNDLSGHSNNTWNFFGTFLTHSSVWLFLWSKVFLQKALKQCFKIKKVCVTLPRPPSPQRVSRIIWMTPDELVISEFHCSRLSHLWNILTVKISKAFILHQHSTGSFCARRFTPILLAHIVEHTA